MNITLFVLAVFVGIAIAEGDNSKKVSLPLVFPTSIFSTKQKQLSPLLRSEDGTKGINFQNVGLTARPYYRLPPFEEYSMNSRLYNNVKSGDAEANSWPLEETIKVNNNPANLNSNAYNRMMLGDISGSSWNHRPRNTKKPHNNRNTYEESNQRHMGDISGIGFKKPNRVRNPFDENNAYMDVYNNYGDRLTPRIIREFPLEIDGVGARVTGDITGGSYGGLAPYRQAAFKGENRQGWQVQKRHADWLHQQRDVDEDEQFPHFPNHAEYF